MSLKEIIELIKVIQEPQKKKDEIIYEYIEYIRNNSMINISQSENNHNDIVNSTYVENNNVHQKNIVFDEQSSIISEISISSDPSIQEVQIQKPIINIDVPIIKIEEETINNKDINNEIVDNNNNEIVDINNEIVDINNEIVDNKIIDNNNNEIVDNNLNKKSLNEKILKINNQLNNIIKKIENPLYISNSNSKYMRIKDFLFKIQKGKCLYCNKNKKIKSLTKEHLIPKSFNGTSNVGNICLVCKNCNAKRGNDMTNTNSIQEILNRISQIWFYDSIKNDIQSINSEINYLHKIINS
tara:strand:+ start:56 stop:949 length:894 start_codon:yes stop_codon:yes gene_type:complete